MSGLSFDLGGRMGARTLAAKLDVPPGPLVLAGPNGAGKTSLLEWILGVRRPARGLVRLGDVTLFDADRGIDLPPEARGIAYLPQDYGLFPHLTALGNVEFAVGCREPLERARREERARSHLADLDALELAHRRPAELSGGERQRVALARALASSPRALLLDEPLAALDAIGRRRLRGFLAELLDRLALPSIVVTHDPDDGRVIGRRVVVLEDGAIVQDGPLEALRAAPATAFVAAFADQG